MAYGTLTHLAQGIGLSGTTSAIDTTGASLIVVVVGVLHSQYPLVSDSKGNTYTGLNQYDNGSCGVSIFYAQNPVVGTGHTFTLDRDAGNFPKASITVLAFSGATLTSVYSGQQNGAATDNGFSSPFATGSITPPNNGSLVVTGFATEYTNSGGPPTVSSGFTIADGIGGDGATFYGSAIAYQIQTTATAVNPSWTIPASTNMAVIVAAFNPAGAGGGATARRVVGGGLASERGGVVSGGVSYTRQSSGLYLRSEVPVPPHVRILK